MTALLDAGPGRRRGEGDGEDWFWLLALTALTVAALLAVRRLSGRGRR